MAATSTEPRLARSFDSFLRALDELDEDPFTEALFTTFGVDVPFFEARVLGPVRATGAVVTVVCDSSVFDPDPRAMHAAGRTYHLGIVDLPAAFHPKVNVLIGPERVLISVGSGNLTTGGWLTNDELVTVVAATRGEPTPRIVVGVSRWLRALMAETHRVRCGAATRDAIRRVAISLESFLEGSVIDDTGPRLVTSLDGPIIDQLPNGTVDELLLQAPFHDPNGAALGALLRRYQPTRVTIAVQRGRTAISPAALDAAARKFGVELRWQDADSVSVAGEYQHGKLVEAISSGGRWTLTGSPNLTAAALLSTLERGGNCEVGVVSPTSESLFRGTGPLLDATAVPELRINTSDGPASEFPIPVLVGATLVMGGVRVELSRPIPYDVDILVSGYAEDPERSSLLGHVAAGTDDTVLPTDDPLDPGSRLQVAYSVDGAVRVGPSVPLLHPAMAVRPRPASHQKARNSYESVTDTLACGDALDAYLRLAERVRTQQAEEAGRPAVRSDRAEGVVSVASGHRELYTGSLHDYLERASARLGSVMIAEFGENLLMPDTLLRTQSPDWEDIVNAADDASNDEQATEEDADAEAAEREQEPANAAYTRDYTDSQKSRWRHSFGRLVDALDGIPEIDRSTYVSLLLVGARFHIWDDATEERAALLARALRSLPGDDIRDELLPIVAAVAALGIYQLNRCADPDHRVGTGREYRETVRRLRPLLEHATEADVSGLLDRLYRGARSTFTAEDAPPVPEDVLAHTQLELDDSPWHGIAARIEASNPDWRVEVIADRHLDIRATHLAERQIAARAMELVPSELTVAVRVTVKDESLRFVRHGRLFVAQELLGPRKIWRAYELGPFMTPSSVATNSETASRAWDRAPLGSVSDAARRALGAAGVNVD